eukprot:1513165-Prorocentrum_lima.AAC.1
MSPHRRLSQDFPPWAGTMEPVTGRGHHRAPPNEKKVRQQLSMIDNESPTTEKDRTAAVGALQKMG